MRFHFSRDVLLLQVVSLFEMSVNVKMSALKLTVFLLLYLLLQGCDAMLYLHTKSINATMNTETGQTLVFDRRTFTDPRVLYAICQAGDRHKKCLVRRFERSLGKEQRRRHECEITIKTQKHGGAISDKIRLVPLGKDRAIVAYLEKTNADTFFGLINVRFRPCEFYSPPEIFQIDRTVDNKPYEFELFAVAENDTEYHVVYNNTKLCGDGYCKLRVDLRKGIDNGIVQGPVRWFRSQEHRQVVDLVPFREKFRRFLILEFGYGESQFSLLNENNDLKPLKLYKRQPNRTSYKTSWTMAYTTANKRVGICNLLDAKLNCVQYDSSGWRIYEWEHIFNENDDIWISAMHNLPADTGILVLLIDHVPNRYKILQFNPTGAQVGQLDVEQFDCDWRENAIAGQFFDPNGEASDTDYCVSLACYDTGEFSEMKEERGHISIVSQCFKLTDLEQIP